MENIYIYIWPLTNTPSAMNQAIVIVVSFTIGAFLTILVQHFNATSNVSHKLDRKYHHIVTTGLKNNTTRRSISHLFARQHPALLLKRNNFSFPSSSSHLVDISIANRITAAVSAIQQPTALRKAFPYSDARPPIRSLFWILWESHRNLRPKLLSTRFTQGILHGNLSPDAYGAWTVVDAYYCFRAATSYQVAARRAAQMNMTDVAAFIATKAREYEAFNNAVFVSDWNLRNRKSIVPSAVIEAYAEFEESVARRMHPVYTLIVQLPCEVVWAWLGDRLLNEIDRRENDGRNLYRKWAEDNVWETAGYAIGNFLQDFQRRYPNAIEDHVAHGLYRKAFEFEIENFNDV